MVNELERADKRTRNRKKENKNGGSGNFGNPKWREKICIRFFMLLTSANHNQLSFRLLANYFFASALLLTNTKAKRCAWQCDAGNGA